LTFWTFRGKDIRLGQRLGVGAEGEVYEVQGRAGLVAKIYYQPPPEEKAEKLAALTRLSNERLLKISAWPVDLLQNKPDGKIIGFLMRKIFQAEEVHALHSPKSRLDKFPDASWAFLIYVAANFARAVAVMHEHGFVIGDLNPKNTLVTRKATVFLLDCDSFQVSIDGKTYRCEGGFPEYTPPELQGIPFREVDRRQEHDYFGLAVVIFQLLFLGRHPFSGQFVGEGEMSLERAIKEYRFAYGDDAGSRQMKQPPGTLSLEAVPPQLSHLFSRAFLSNSAADRPRPRDWIEPLESLTKCLRRCSLHSGHNYYRELCAGCPWCAIETSARIRLFNFATNGANQLRGHFRLTELWNEIAAVLPPPEKIAANDSIYAEPGPSAEVVELEQQRREDLTWAICFSVFAGLLIAWLTDFPIAILPLVLAGLIARRIGKTTPKHTDIQKIEDNRQLAQTAVQTIEERWKNEATADRFLATLGNLKNQRDTYLNLPQIREHKLKQLENAAREDQLDEFLDQFEVKGAEIRGIGPSFKTFMFLNGVETAADLTAERLQRLPGIDPSRAEGLLQWRRGLERQFVYDHTRAVPPQTRIKVEREIDSLRHRLERELSSGAFYLRRLKQEIEESRQRLQPALVDARDALAQAEKDLEIVSKKKRSKLAPIALFIAFLLGSAVEPPKLQPVKQTPRLKPAFVDPIKPSAPPKPPAPSSNGDVIVRMDENEAKLRYREGVDLSRQERFQEAVQLLRKSVQLNPQLNTAYEELGYALYRLGEYEGSIEASKTAIRLNNDFGPHYNLGLVYIAQENWYGAMYSFQSAIAYRNRHRWADTYTHAYYYLGQSLTKLGEVQVAIASLENALKASPQLTVERFELANLYLWVGKNKAAIIQRNVLLSTNEALAKELSKLIKRHGSRRSSSVSRAVASVVPGIAR
jgi:DNA-binding helix-hairpin-helix protein with protein kinase domain/Tfp pilus assembly protein PilF